MSGTDEGRQDDTVETGKGATIQATEYNVQSMYKLE